jgi:hypothetical protein
MGRMLILGGLIAGLVGLAGNGQTPSAKEETSSVQTPPPSSERPVKPDPCPPKSGQKIISAVIVPAEGKCGLKVHPEVLCAAPGGTIYWFIDAQKGDSPECKKAIRKIKLHDFKLVDDGGVEGDPFEAGKCSLEVAKPGQGIFLIQCDLRPTGIDGNNYEYSIVGLDGEGNVATVADPEIRVRG